MTELIPLGNHRGSIGIDQTRFISDRRFCEDVDVRKIILSDRQIGFDDFRLELEKSTSVLLACRQRLLEE